MRTQELFLIYPLLFILINGLISIGDMIFKFNFKYYLFLNSSTLLSIVIFWFPFTVIPNWIVGFSGYSTLVVTTCFLIFLYRFNQNVKQKYKNIIPIFILVGLLCFILFWFIKYPPHGDDMIKYKYYEAMRIQTQNITNFIIYFITFSISLVIFSVKYFYKKHI